jgi:hypothetical protein
VSAAVSAAAGASGVCGARASASAGASAAGFDRILSITDISEPKPANIARSIDAGRSFVCGALIITLLEG